MEFTFVEKDLPKVAQKLLFNIKSKVWLLCGPMGSGKTTLIKTLVKILGVTDMTSSPTFSLVNEYISHKGDILYHFDFYRIKKEEEALDMGIDDYFYSGNYCFVEWPDKIENLVPLNAVAIYITVNADGTRTLTFKN
jgi:tRNA threonylcarbamoyladenosine biosynthesis protein TsaE